ncbi:MAG: YihY/virulence factor BrkB family protein [Acetobacteraceae bacterium]
MATDPDIPPCSAPPVRHGAARGWRGVLLATLEALTTDRASMAAAGAAFYATLALFPAISTLISLYGLMFNRASVASQLKFLHGLLPPPAYTLIANRVEALVNQPPGQLGAGLAVASVVAFWSASAGTRSVLSALNVAYDVTEQRGILRFYAITLGMTLAAMLVAVAGIAVLVALPVVAGFVGLAAYTATAVVHLAAMAMLVGFVAASVAVLYRVGPATAAGSRRLAWPGVAVATVLWLTASGALSFYVAHLANLGATYGPLGAVVGVMMWFYLSVYAVLVGAEVNAQMEQGGSFD